MVPSDRSGRAFAAAQADILVRIFGECRGMLAIQLHYRALDPLKFIICLALARVLVRGRGESRDQFQHRGDGEILGRAAGRRAGLGGAVRADVPVPEVTI
jgi:hypothetical protein